ncbi:N-acetylglucosamine-6-phosphate deacetylase [Gynuella sp.]|uniref:N-acetylglucosamine-6-phosphate deacetylase n=1 Tax=Gynuella sp. TaxID=2969146 RepID=UPI003D0D6AAF
MHAVSAPRIFTGETFLTDQAVIIESGNIQQLCPVNQVPAGIPHHILRDGFICAGLIDLQVNGGGGLLFNEHTQSEALFQIADAHRQFGTTSILATLISDTPQVVESGIRAVKKAHQQNPGQILGIHIEGPFFNPARRGIHDTRFVRSPSVEDLEILATAGPAVHLMTLAPEQVDREFIHSLRQMGYHVWGGHSEASYQQVRAAIKAGLTGFTHLYNAMSQQSAREPGMLGTALAADQCWAGIIADGFHVHKNSIEVALRCKPKGKLLLVSDAMSTIGTDKKQFMLNGQVIREKQGMLVNQQGTLAGSAITLMDAVHYLVENLNMELEEALRMASVYPAEAISLGHVLGRIKPGYIANLIHIEKQSVLHSWIDGKLLEHRIGEAVCV